MMTLDEAIAHAYKSSVYARNIMFVNLCQDCQEVLRGNDMVATLCQQCGARMLLLMHVTHSVPVEYCPEHLMFHEGES